MMILAQVLALFLQEKSFSHSPGRTTSNLITSRWWIRVRGFRVSRCKSGRLPWTRPSAQVGDTENPQDDFQAAIIDSVRKVGPVEDRTSVSHTIGL